MDFYLSYNNNEFVMTFPVIPNGGITLKREQANASFESVRGQMRSIGNVGLASFDLASFFPNKPYTFARPGSLPNGWSYVIAIESARKRNIPFRAIYKNNDGIVVFNMPVTVDSFEWGVNKWGDIDYSLSFTEYRFAEITPEAEPEQVFTGDAVKTEAQKESDTVTITTPSGGTTTFERKYTETDAVMMAKVFFCESRGIKSKTEIACLGWTILNRLDKGGYGKNIYSVITMPNQFAYKASAKTVSDWGYDLVELAKDVLDRWSREKAGQSNVGRVLPSGYFWYMGDGKHNYFYNDYNKFRKNLKGYAWNYAYKSPYA